MKKFKVVVEKHPDTYVAYPLDLKGVVVGQGFISQAESRLPRWPDL